MLGIVVVILVVTLVVFRCVCVCLRCRRVCLVVTDVFVSHSMVSVLGEDFCSASKSEFVEPQSFSLWKAMCALS